MRSISNLNKMNFAKTRYSAPQTYTHKHRVRDSQFRFSDEYMLGTPHP